ncbi:MAG: hypothetical protein OHK0017_12410 [Patescibacteria group bacterium]
MTIGNYVKGLQKNRFDNSRNLNTDLISNTLVWLFLVSCILAIIFIEVKYQFPLSLRLDESQSLWQVSHTPSKILEIVSSDVHVPLYHLLLHYWVLVFGFSVESARSMSLLFAIFSIPAMYLLGWQAFGRKIPALFSVFLLSISPIFNWYGSEIRMYSLLVLISILNQFFYLRIYRKPSNWAWLGFALTSLLGIYTHYFFWLLVGVNALFFILNLEKFGGLKSFQKYCLLGLGLILSFTPWIYLLLSNGTASNTKPNLIQPTSVDIFNLYSQFLFGFINESFNSLIVSMWPVVILVVFLLLQRKRVNSLKAEFKYFMAVIAVPTALAYLISLAYRPVFLSRYLILVVPSLLLTISYTLFTFRSRIGDFLKLGLLVIILFGFFEQTVNAYSPVKEDYIQVVTYLEMKVTTNQVIAITAPFTIYPFEYYYRGHQKVVTIPDWDRYGPNSIPGFDQQVFNLQIKQLSRDYNQIWIVYSYNQGYEDSIRNYMRGNYKLVEKSTFSKDLTLESYQI